MLNERKHVRKFKLQQKLKHKNTNQQFMIDILQLEMKHPSIKHIEYSAKVHYTNANQQIYTGILHIKVIQKVKVILLHS